MGAEEYGMESLSEYGKGFTDAVREAEPIARALERCVALLAECRDELDDIRMHLPDDSGKPHSEYEWEVTPNFRKRLERMVGTPDRASGVLAKIHFLGILPER